jgi:hypothetical protein
MKQKASRTAENPRLNPALVLSYLSRNPQILIFSAGIRAATVSSNDFKTGLNIVVDGAPYRVQGK